VAASWRALCRLGRWCLCAAVCGLVFVPRDSLDSRELELELELDDVEEERETRKEDDEEEDDEEEFKNKKSRCIPLRQAIH